jgi:hypothetical protein
MAVRAWSLYAHAGENPYAGHTGYDDSAGRHYSYDSRVANHRQVRVGDLVVVRGPDTSHGAGFIPQVSEDEGIKIYSRCPTCKTSQLERRKTLSPIFRCTNGHTFDEPIKSEERVTRYRAEFAPGYLELDDFGAETIDALCLHGSRQNAIRELDLQHVLAALRKHGVFPGFVRVASGR